MSKKIRGLCEWCGKEYVGWGKRFCSVACMGKWRSEVFVGERGANWRGGKAVGICEQCGAEFERDPCQIEAAKFCSRKCMGKWRSENLRGENSPGWRGGKIIQICEWCGGKFKAKLSSHRIFCSLDCQRKWQSKERRGENSPTWNGGPIKKICEQCGIAFEVNAARTNTARFCSQGCKGKWMSENLNGEDHPNWQGGISREPYGFEFDDDLKAQIRERDNYVCAICGLPQEEETLHVHHIDGDKKNNDPSNLISLHCSCHMRTNYNREYWQNLLAPIAKERKVLLGQF